VTPLPLSRTGAEIPFYAVIAAFGLLEQRIRLRSILNRAGERHDGGSFFVFVACIGGGIAGAFVLAAHVPGAAVGGGARWPLFLAGLALMIAGIGLRQWSIALLGRFFTVDVRVQSDQTVIESGPYRWVRHPSYTGLLLTLIGIGVALGNGLSFAALLIPPLLATVLRIRVEEHALLDGLGEPYRRYAAGRARLIPYVW
jgi:protein-S-isoprenylcysteine O-methyltransferase Ste14